MKKKVGEQLIPLATLILTFDQCRLPNFIKAGWLSIKVKPYIPSPLRCYHCQMYGHLSQKCKERLNDKPSICANCGKNSHGLCKEAPCCIHCGEAHPATSKSCVKFIFEREIQAIRTMEKVTFKEARRRALEKQIRPGEPFSLVLKRNNIQSDRNLAVNSSEKPSSPCKEPSKIDNSSDRNHASISNEIPSISAEKLSDKDLASCSNQEQTNRLERSLAVVSSSDKEKAVGVEKSSENKSHPPTQEVINSSQQVPEEPVNIHKPSGSRERLTSLVKSIINMGSSSSDSNMKEDSTVSKPDRRPQGKKKRDITPERRPEEKIEQNVSLPPRTLIRKGAKIKRIDSNN